MDQVLHRRFDRLAAGGEDILDLRAADDLAHRTLGHRFHGLVGMTQVERVIFGVGRVDLPDDTEFDVCDIVVARQHQALCGDFLAVLEAGPPRIFMRNGTDVDGIAVRDREFDDVADRVWQVVVQAGSGLTGILTEDEVYPDLVGRHRVEAARHPQQHDDEHTREQPKASVAAARQHALQAGLAAPEELLEVGRGWPTAAGSGTLAPWAGLAGLPRPSAALITPGHSVPRQRHTAVAPI